ncbi:hypothetical protein [Saccharopolyspora hattusasensis]|uniref:hypothetical protein n=1 Tax=Saccharopolyspora hattusasensis TaxID=1128679 RepID=UPI003D972BD6
MRPFDTSHLATQFAEIASWLDETLDSGLALSLFPLRQGEFDSVCNVVPLVERFSVARVYGAQWQGLPWFDFRVHDYGRPWTGAAQFHKIQAPGILALDSAGTRDLQVVTAELMLLPTHWVFDPLTGSMLTSDLFGHVCGRAVQSDVTDWEQDMTTVQEHLVGNRYWWLPGARTTEIAEAIRQLFAQRTVNRIIPAHGAILEGEEVVTHHVEVVCSVIEVLGGEEPARPLSIGSGLPTTAPNHQSAPPRPTIPPGPVKRKLPRELQPGLNWLGACLEQRYKGQIFHSYNSVYVVSGTQRSVIVEGGFPSDLDVLDAQLDELLATGIPPVEFLFATHCETPHASGIGRFLQKFPKARAVGGVHDLHLVFPEFADRIQVPGPAGVSLDLGGGRFFRSVPAVIRDLTPTFWGFDTKAATLFPADGFSFSHYHSEAHCGLVAEEAGSLDMPDMTALFAELALIWTRFTDIEPYIGALEKLLSELGVELIAPTHGLPITDLAATVPQVVDGLRLGAWH